MAYGPPSQPAYAGPTGSCSQWYAGRLVQVDPGASQPGLAGPAVRADPGCQITSVAATARGGKLAIEACGSAPGYLNGPARVLVMTGGAVRRLALGQCTDGNGLATGQSGTSTLVSAYLYCNPPGKPGPVTRLWEYSGGTLRPIAGNASGAAMLAWPG